MVKEVDLEERSLKVRFDEWLVEYDQTELD